MNERAEERLNQIAAILALANRKAIKAAREEIRSDPLSAAILEACSGGWTAVAAIRTAVAKSNKASSSTVSRRLADLVADGGLYHRGATTSSEYRLTGLV